MRMFKCSQIYRLLPLTVMLALLAGCRTSEVKINPDLSFSKCKEIYYIIAINDEYSLHDHNKGYDGGASSFSSDLIGCLYDLCSHRWGFNVRYLEYDTKTEDAIPDAPKLKDAATIEKLLNQLRLKHDPQYTGELLLCVVMCDVGWGMPELKYQCFPICPDSYICTFLNRIQVFIYDIKTKKLWLKSDYQKHLSYRDRYEGDYIFNPIKHFIVDKKNGEKFTPEEDGYILYRDGKQISPFEKPQSANQN